LEQIAIDDNVERCLVAERGMPPMAKPVDSRTRAASARPIDLPRADASSDVSARFEPETSARTGSSSARKTSDFTMHGTLVPIAEAASWAVRVLSASSTMSGSMRRPGALGDAAD